MSILDTIVAYKQKEVKAAKSVISCEQMRRGAYLNLMSTHSFVQAIKASPTGIIAEFKRRSPSKGEIRAMADAAHVVRGYTRAGAACCSILTDTAFFGGSLNDFSIARGETHLPLLRKEFIIDEYQIYQSRLHHADAVLLIAAVLTAAQISNFIRIAHDLNMQTLLELHNEHELDRFDAATDMVGINNRNLHNFVTNIDASCKLIDRLPKDVVKISESGLSEPSQLKELRAAGFDGFLIGERFMKHDDPGDALKQFINAI
jgi:indole-3-glycerol phosphate synthase